MQLSVAFFLVVAVAFVAAGPVDPKDAQILKSDFNIEPAGQYRFGFETDNAIVRAETGELRAFKNEEGKDDAVVVVQGSYSYPGEDGRPLTITYVADENGYRAVGDHLPVAPVA